MFGSQSKFWTDRDERPVREVGRVHAGAESSRKLKPNWVHFGCRTGPKRANLTRFDEKVKKGWQA